MVSSKLKKIEENENGTNSIDRIKSFLKTIKKEIRSYYIIIFCVGTGILISLLRMQIDGVGYSSDEYDIYAEYFKGIFQNKLSFEQELWFDGYRLKNRILYPFILSIGSLITTLEPAIIAIPLGIIFFLLSILTTIQILKERGNSQKEINIIVSPFAVTPGLLPHMVRPTTDHLFMLLVLIVLLFIIRFVKRGDNLNLLIAIFFSLLAIITREFGFLLLFILPILYIVKWMEEKRYLMILVCGIFIIILIWILLQILNFTPSFVLSLIFGVYTEKIQEIIISGNVSLEGVFQILHIRFIEQWTQKGFLRTYELIESVIYTIFIAFIFSFLGFLSWDKEKKVKEVKNVERSVLVVWFILGIFSLMILHGTLQARYWMPIMIIPYLEIPSGINYLHIKLKRKLSEKMILSLILIIQITISIIRIVFTTMNISLRDVINVLSLYIA
ncbi:MAG: hypothetical protein ACFFB5_00580 [Promethearchaeota archaeon]